MIRRLIAASALACAALLGAWFASTPPKLPAFVEVRARWRPSDAQLLDRHGDPIDELRIDVHGRRLAWTPLDEVSPAVRDAIIASEDHRFATHHGVDLRALAGAIAGGLEGRRFRGASTITMQVAPMLDGSLGRSGGKRSIFRKLRQIQTAFAIERQWSKDQILEAYVNLVAFRGELQGIAAASRVMFGKAPHGVDRAEAVVLAALVRSPNARAAALTRRALALSAAMRPATSESAEVQRAVGRALGVRSRGFARVALAPHLASRMLHAPQYSARCTLDAGLQRFTAEALRRHVAEVRDRHVDDGAVLVVENATGEVWAYVGGTGDLSSAQFVDGVLAMRQPGSALKPFLYALAIQSRLLTPASILEDTPLELPEERGLYRPLDYDRQFRGLVSMRTALASSLNIPAVRTADMIGAESFARHLRTLKFDGIVESGDYYGAALALGDADVSLWQIVAAYRALANRGVWSEPQIAPAGDRAPAARRIYDPATAFLVSDILADRASRSVTFGLENSLATRFWSAVKTGTSKDMRDNWCIGFTDRFTVGVWVGNFSGAPMRDVSGITGAAPIWLDVMNYLHERFGSGEIAPPEGVVARNVSFPKSIESPRREWFVAGTEPDSPMASLDDSNPTILSPAPAMTVAIDPDIPRELQRIAFEAGPGSDALRWNLDRKDLGPARGVTLWPPAPGAHTLSLVNESGRTVDTVEFKVRGAMPVAEVETAGANAE
ncbi:MAG TPA: penicillin-binding protein 1C [Candidatus Binataceae bacterium]